MKFQFYPPISGSSFIIFCLLASVALSSSVVDDNGDSSLADLSHQSKRSAAVPYSGGLYGKRSRGVPFSGGLYGKRKRQLPFVMGAAWNDDGDDGETWPALAAASRSNAYAYKRAGGVPFSGGFYGKRAAHKAYDFYESSKKAVPFSGGLYG
uniref:Uncharacterized protein n=1 Tax=Romanomermis culicivorax TaxID=13658 RepID=A0A915IA42_ROMCU